MRCYLFDLDGTLCNIEHRLHYINKEAYLALDDGGNGYPPFKPDWDAFYAACVGDTPIEPICTLVRSLHNGGNDIIFVSGRSDAVRQQTKEWIYSNVLPILKRTQLFMRKDGDHRPDHIVKGEMLDEILAAGWEPIMAFDDRKQVVDMWRARGLVCAQVAEGDF